MFRSLTFLDHRHVLVPLAAAVTTKHRKNVAVISSNNSLLYLMCTGSQRYAWSRHLFCIALEAGIYCENKGSIEKARDLWEIEPLLIGNHISVFYYLSMV